MREVGERANESDREMDIERVTETGRGRERMAER